MPLVTVTNRQSTDFMVPPPVARRLGPGQFVTLQLDVAELESDALREIGKRGLCSFTVVADTTIPDQLEGATQQDALAPARSTVQTVDATVTTVATVAIPTGTVVMLEAKVLGADTALAEAASYVLVGAFKNIAGTVTQIGTTTVVSSLEADALWDCVLDISGTNVRVRVTGQAATVINWYALCVKHVL